MIREGLDTYDVLPEDMCNYLANYGRHFNKKLVKFAVDTMVEQHSSTGELTNLKSYSKEDVDNILKGHAIKLKNNQLYDYVYVANKCKFDYLGDSVPDEYHLAKYIKNEIDDVDTCDGLVFTLWYASTRRKGIAIDWEMML